MPLQGLVYNGGEMIYTGDADMSNEERILDILSSMQADISGMKGDISGLKDDVSGMKGDIRGLKDDVTSLKDDVKSLSLRMDNVEQRLDNLENNTLKTNTYIENTIVPRLDALWEGQQALKDTKADRNRIEDDIQDLRADMTMMKRLYMKQGAN